MALRVRARFVRARGALVFLMACWGVATPSPGAKPLDPECGGDSRRPV